MSGRILVGGSSNGKSYEQFFSIVLALPKLNPRKLFDFNYFKVEMRPTILKT
jgi:hypothetical protein